MIPSPPQARERRLEPVELTPVHQRTSRRLRGEQPEFGPLFDSSRPVETVSSDATMAAQATPSPSHIVVDSPRTPEPQALHRVQPEPQLQLSYAQVVRQDLGRTIRTAPAAVIPPTFPLSTPPPMPENWRAKRAIQRRIARAPTPRAEEEDWRLME
ncbi:hypothetical protein HPB52_021980 [Rhipicephalus sanguineus]|uniref:Uncharacterized protein n=1 Tax=Rhipicephalus sanguineus TaxID=34632 RepID=A0A9D4PQD1_RHISA|nr:hypothetical protein HPB52_021980 [Rhipicephalus sanguineus]